jgi:glycine dehydrogenase subunit 1
MPFIPHTEQDVQDMLNVIGAPSIDKLFDEIPSELRNDNLAKVGPGLSEMHISQLMQSRANANANLTCFAGAGAYDHHIPAAVWEITTRGEFYSAYTPYQAEASQGTLQLIYEYQSMMTGLTGMDVSNASLYDGASGLAEAILMAVRANRKSKSGRILYARNCHPAYIKTSDTIVKNQNIKLEAIDFDPATGNIEQNKLPADPGDFAALIISQPNFFGNLEDVDRLTHWAHEHGSLVIGVVNPTSLAMLTPPGEWGDTGADIVCGDGQALGIPMASGGPYFGFLCCDQKLVRQMPGRIVGRTVDLDGKEGFTLTLQAREQHIRRSKATSNICTNQGLLVTAATIYMSVMGQQGLQQVAAQSHANTIQLVEALTSISGVERLFNQAYFHEAVIKLPKPAAQVIHQLASQGILAGVELSREFPELDNALLICATEKRTADEITHFRDALAAVLGS